MFDYYKVLTDRSTNESYDCNQYYLIIMRFVSETNDEITLADETKEVELFSINPLYLCPAKEKIFLPISNIISILILHDCDPKSKITLMKYILSQMPEIISKRDGKILLNLIYNEADFPTTMTYFFFLGCLCFFSRIFEITEWKNNDNMIFFYHKKYGVYFANY